MVSKWSIEPFGLDPSNLAGLLVIDKSIDVPQILGHKVKVTVTCSKNSVVWSSTSIFNPYCLWGLLVKASVIFCWKMHVIQVFIWLNQHIQNDSFNGRHICITTGYLFPIVSFRILHLPEKKKTGCIKPTWVKKRYHLKKMMMPHIWRVSWRSSTPSWLGLEDLSYWGRRHGAD